MRFFYVKILRIIFPLCNCLKTVFVFCYCLFRNMTIGLNRYRCYCRFPFNFIQNNEIWFFLWSEFFGVVICWSSTREKKIFRKLIVNFSDINCFFPFSRQADRAFFFYFISSFFFCFDVRSGEVETLIAPNITAEV